MNDASARERFEQRRTTLRAAVARIPRGRHIFIGSGAAEPVGLVEELVAQRDRFADNVITHLLTLGPAPYVEPACRDRFRHNAFFIGPNVRDAVHEGRADYTPVFLSQIPELMRRRRMPVDVALVQVTPPDRYGFVNLGVSVDVVLAAVECAELVIAEVNPLMPVVYGDGYVPIDRIDAWVERAAPLPTITREAPDAVACEIGRHVASLVADRSTLQIGIGQIPDAVVASLANRKDLGVWTEMLTDGLVDLVEAGNVTGKYKVTEPHKVSASFTFGAGRVYEMVDRNPVYSFHPSDFINDPQRIARQHRMVAVNGALQIDLTGQVCADSIGSKFYSGIGGQVDFIRGASMSPGGKAIIATRSTAKDGSVSRIVAALDEGAGVVTSRGDVEYIVTEHGIADLRGRSIRERAIALISVAHPDHRPELLASAKARHYVFADQIEPPRSLTIGLETWVTTTDGEEVLFRPLRVTDEQKMSDMFYRLSERTIYNRWMTGMRRMPHRTLQHYLDVDDVENVAIVVEHARDGEESEIVGVARYHVIADSAYADVAFAVRDDWRGKGLGSALLARLAEIAGDHGIRGFVADVLAENRVMLHVFQKSGLPMQSQLEGGVFHLEMPFVASAGDGG